MDQRELSSKSPVFKNMNMSVTRTPGGNGNAGNGTYQVDYSDQSKFTVDTDNTILNYQLVAPTPLEIVFTGMRTNQQDAIQQFSQPSISLDGKMMTFSDANSWSGAIGVTLLWRDGVEISHDPQVVNTPQP